MHGGGVVGTQGASGGFPGLPGFPGAPILENIGITQQAHFKIKRFKITRSDYKLLSKNAIYIFIQYF